MILLKKNHAAFVHKLNINLFICLVVIMVHLRDTAYSIKRLTLVWLMFKKAIWIKHSITYVNTY